jgi:hypothetical protein
MSRMLRVQNEQGMDNTIPCCDRRIPDEVVVRVLFEISRAEQHFARVRDE